MKIPAIVLAGLLSGCGSTREHSGSGLPVLENPAPPIAKSRARWIKDPASVEVNVLLAEAHARTLEGLDVKSPDHERHRAAGLFHGQEATRLAPNSGEAHYWLGAVLLHTAEAERSMGRTKDAMTHLARAEALSPAVDSGGPARLQGRVLAEMPALVGGSKEKAEEAYQRSLKAAPGSLQTRLWMAELHIATGKRDLAKKELEGVVADGDAEFKKQAEAKLRDLK